MKLKYRYKQLKLGVCAELSAVIKGRQDDYRKCTMIVMRVDKNDQINSSKPCLGCQNMLDHLNFKEVIYTDKDGNFITYAPEIS